MTPATNELFAVSMYGPGGTLSIVNLPSGSCISIDHEAGGGPVLSMMGPMPTTSDASCTMACTGAPDALKTMPDSSCIAQRS